MSDIRLYVDEDAAEQPVMQGLRARGVDLLTTSEANRLGATDADQLAFGVDQGRTIYTFNVGDFARLHRQYLEAGTDLSVCYAQVRKRLHRQASTYSKSVRSSSCQSC